ncbi:MAG: SMC-Scp complex subunit ScpB [Clostridia bacterium]|nr:SMC-Scp complex subunit ScpB [Clostridia bacterium]
MSLIEEMQQAPTESVEALAKKAPKKKAKKPISVIPEIVDVPPEIGETIEAILFAAGHAVTYASIARVLSLSLEKARQIVYSYSLIYNDSPIPRGVMMLTFDDSCQLCTKAEYLPYIREALGIRRGGNLSNSSIETLAIIAYNQPVTRSYIDTVRGVDSSYAVNSLLERSLIESKGRLDAPGRPMLYGTTPDFLRCFGLSSLTELPGVTSEEAAEMLSKLSKQICLEVQPDQNQMIMDAAVLDAPQQIEDPDDAPVPDKTAVAIGETPDIDE